MKPFRTTSLFFARLFLWFWAAMVGVIIAFMGSVLVTDPEMSTTRWQTLAERSAVLHARDVSTTLTKGGSAAVRDYLRREPLYRGLPTYLFLASGEEATGQSMDASVRKAFVDAPRGSDLIISKGGTVNLVTYPVSQPAGAMLVALFPRGPADILRLDFMPWVMRLTLIVAVAGGVCYVLARHLTAPIRSLRRVTRRFATGELDARADPRSPSAADDEVAGLAEDFNEMARRIQELLNSQHRLLQDVSHELRSPLTRLGLAVELAKRNTTGGDRNELARIERETSRLCGLVEELLKIGRLDSELTSQAHESFDLSSLIREIVDDVNFETTDRGLGVQILDEYPCLVHGHREALRSAIENVLRNAVRYSPEGTRATVSLHGSSAEGRVWIAVRDEGTGVPDDALPLLFEPFFRVGDARDRQSGGLGLGLAITRRILQLQGGTVFARNLPDRGLEVEITLPCTVYEPEPSQP